MSFAKRSARRRGMVIGAAVAKRRSVGTVQPPAQPQAPAPIQPATTPTDDVAAQIKQFAELRDQGILTEEEFSAKKKQLLGL